MAKVLITGGAGFIGSHYARLALKEHDDWEVTVLDKLTYAGNLDNLKDIESHSRYSFVKGDICDKELLDELLSQRFDILVNFAAESHVDRSIQDATPFVKTNVEGTQVLLDAAGQHEVALFLQVSTDEVYGSLESEFGSFTEESPFLPNNPYSATKAAAECLCRAYHQTFGMPVIVTRCANNFGPAQFPEKLIPTVITNALEDTKIPIFGSGQSIRDWVFVEDHCRGIDLAIQSGRPGQVYNINGSSEKPNLELAQLILSMMDKPQSLIEFVGGRPGDDRKYAIDASKIREELGWKSATTFEEGLRKTIDWYADNERWWQPIKHRKEFAEYYRDIRSR